MTKGLTTYYLLHKTYPVSGDETILFHAAAGGVGQIFCQWAKSLGCKVIGTVGNDEKINLAKKYGCYEIINYTKEDFANLNEKFDVIWDANGNRSFPEVEKCLTNNVIYVTTKNNIYNQIDFAKQFMQRKKSKVVLSARSTTSNLDMFRMWIEDGKLRPIIEKTFTFDEFKDAYEHLAGGRAKGKIVLKIN